MSDNLKLNTSVRRLVHYINDFEKGIIRVPAFQRDFVWNIKDKIELFESIKLGYPIGSILFWRPDFNSKEDFIKFETDTIGAWYLPDRADDYFYILDGFQRLSTVFGCLINPIKTILKKNDDEWQNEFNMIYNLETDKFEQNMKKNLNDLPIHKVPLYKFVDGKEFFDFQKKLIALGLEQSTISEYIKKYETLSSTIIDYSLPSINMNGGSIKEAIEIFTRVNSRGAEIKENWKMSALTFNKEKDFRLMTEIKNVKSEGKVYNFNGIKDKLIFDCIKNSFGELFFDKVKNDSDLVDLASNEKFVDITRTTLINIKKAIKFLFEECVVIDSKLLPYNIQFVLITDFFSKVKYPSINQLEILKKWFLSTSFTNYFTSNLQFQRKANNQFQKFINDENISPLYDDNRKINLTVSLIKPKIDMGSVRAKSTVLFMLNKIKNELSFDTKNIKGFIVYNLFPEIDKDSDRNIIENTILIFNSQDFKENLGIDPSLKSLSFMLDNNNKNYSSLFITQEMKNRYAQDHDKNEILNLRKTEIQNAEKQFVESLGLEYYH